MEREVDASPTGPMERRVYQPVSGTDEAKRRGWVYVRMGGEVSHTISLDEWGEEILGEVNNQFAWWNVVSCSYPYEGSTVSVKLTGVYVW